MEHLHSGSLGQVHDDRSVGIEEIVSGHTGLSGDPGRNDDHITSLQSFAELIVSLVSGHFGGRVDV